MRRRRSHLGKVLPILVIIATSQIAVAHSGTTIRGAGATFQTQIIERWSGDFKQSNGSTIEYSPIGSRNGRAELIAGNVDFSVSDLPASADEEQQLRAKYGNFVYVIDTSGGISIVYNVDGFPNLRLTSPTLAKIFSGAVKNWNDPAIAADNGSTGPDLPIHVFVREDDCLTSMVFTEYLSVTAPADWRYGKTSKFPTDGGQTARLHSTGVAAAVVSTEGAIGYVDPGHAEANNLSVAQVRNSSGKFRGPSISSVKAAIDEATVNSNGTLTLNYTSTNRSVYPISTVSYVIAPTTMEAHKGDDFKAFLGYALSGEGQDRVVDLGYVPLSSKLTRLSMEQVDKINS